MRVGIALIQQESNTFAPRTSGLRDFTVLTGVEAANHTRGTNSEMGGALAAVEDAGHIPVPLLYAWALPSGVVTADAFVRLQGLLADGIASAVRLDALILALHGSMVAEDRPDADADLIEAARAAAGAIPIGVSLDLHANVTKRMVGAADALVGYHTDPHTDMADTGRRIAGQVVSMLAGDLNPTVALSKLPMIVPAESMNTTSGPLAPIRARADAVADALDISLFPVQPWLDVPELGFGVLVTTDGDLDRAATVADDLACRVWRLRREFRVPRFLPPDAAIAEAASSSVRPFVIAESADAPTAGAAGDSPVMIAALLESDAALSAVVPVVDPTAVDQCHASGRGAVVELSVGATVDDRWWEPVAVRATVVNIGDGRYRLEGAGFTGIEVGMGRFAVVETQNVTILLSERPAWTADPATFRFAGVDPYSVDVIVVRSCSDFRPNFPDSAGAAVTLDVPGTATPRLEHLDFVRAPRPLWPLDEIADAR